MRGRLIQKTKTFIVLQNYQGTKKVPLTKTRALPPEVKPGDWLEVSPKKIQHFTPNLKSDRNLKWFERTLDPRRLRNMRVRQKTELAIRRYFEKNRFLEVKTPLLVPCPGMEPHIRPFAVKGIHNSYYLPTSPEFAMKKLLAGGLERIYQLTSSFRDEPHSNTHLPEFTMLEWYQSFCNYDDLMEQTENLVASTAKSVLGSHLIRYQGKQINVKPPWPRLSVRSLFLTYTGIDLGTHPSTSILAAKCNELSIRATDAEAWDDLYFKLWLNHIEPKLPANRACFVLDYPPSQAALSLLKKETDGTTWAKRFEAYIGGVELCNAFEELLDPEEQRHRFIADMDLREQIYGDDFPKNPIDEDFLDALAEGLPPCSGNALGVDRLIMLLADETDIHYTTWLS